MLVFILTALLAGQAATPADVATYTLSVVPREGDIARVLIRMSFRGEADGETRIRLPYGYAGETDLHRNVHALVLASPGEFLEGDAPHVRTIRHAPGAMIELAYEIRPDRAGEPHADALDYHRPIVTGAHIHLIGSTIFIRPDASPARRYVFRQERADGDWPLITDMDHGGDGLAAIRDAVFLAGDYRVEQRDLDGARVRIALRGDIGPDDDALADAILRAMRGHHLYWGDPGEPYLVAVSPMTAGEAASSVGGVNLGDAFAIFTTPQPDQRALLRILAHEYAHAWNPRRLGGSVHDGDPATGYWFTEGFTDFLTQRAGLLGGAWNAETGLANWNEALAEYAASPLRDAPNSVVAEQYWSSEGAGRMPYLRGMLFAALVEAAIREHTGGAMDLDDVFLALRETADQGAAPDRFADAVERVTGLDVTDLTTRHIENGEPIVLPHDAFDACGLVETTPDGQVQRIRIGEGDPDWAACADRLAGR